MLTYQKKKILVDWNQCVSPICALRLAAGMSLLQEWQLVCQANGLTATVVYWRGNHDGYLKTDHDPESNLPDLCPDYCRSIALGHGCAPSLSAFSTEFHSSSHSLDLAVSDAFGDECGHGLDRGLSKGEYNGYSGHRNWQIYTAVWIWPSY